MSHCMILRNNECCLNSSAFFNDLVVIILIHESLEFIKTFFQLLELNNETVLKVFCYLV